MIRQQLMELPHTLRPSALAVWVAIFVQLSTFELWNALDKESGDTLSEVAVHYMAKWPVLEGALVGFFAWLVIHWQFFGNAQDGMILVGFTWPLVFTAAGIGLRVLLGPIVFGPSVVGLIGLAAIVHLAKEIKFV